MTALQLEPSPTTPGQAPSDVKLMSAIQVLNQAADLSVGVVAVSSDNWLSLSLLVAGGVRVIARRWR